MKGNGRPSSESSLSCPRTLYSRSRQGTAPPYAFSHFSITLTIPPRSCMTRSEMYYRALAMTNRLHELQELHHWSAEEASVAIKLIDEPMPIGLHMSVLSRVATCVLTISLAFEPVIRTQGSAVLKQKYGELIAHRGILGQVPNPACICRVNDRPSSLGAICKPNSAMEPTLPRSRQQQPTYPRHASSRSTLRR